MDMCCKAGADYNASTALIERFKGEHNHPANPQKLRAMLEEVTVVQNMVDCVATQFAKPQHILSKVIDFTNFIKIKCQYKLLSSEIDFKTSIKICLIKHLFKVCSNLVAADSEESLAYVSSKETLRSKTRRAKMKAKQTVPEKVPTTWEALKANGIPERFTNLPSSKPFLR